MADVAHWAAVTVWQQQRLASGVDASGASAVEQSRLAEAEARLADAIDALDRAIGVTPAELTAIGAALDRLPPS